jgi:hypothetical protein
VRGFIRGALAKGLAKQSRRFDDLASPCFKIMNDKTLLAIGVAAVATPVLAFVVFNSPGHSSVPAPVSQNAVALPSQISTASAQSPVVSKLEQPPLTGEAAKPSSGIQVTPADQEKLAQMVELSDKPNQSFNKEKWTKAIPIAQKLADQSADCEQRNWLNQFVAVGNMGLEGSPDFQKYAPVLATMYRDNMELQTGQPSN